MCLKNHNRFQIELIIQTATPNWKLAWVWLHRSLIAALERQWQVICDFEVGRVYTDSISSFVLFWPAPHLRTSLLSPALDNKLLIINTLFTVSLQCWTGQHLTQVITPPRYRDPLTQCKIMKHEAVRSLLNREQATVIFRRKRAMSATIA